MPFKILANGQVVVKIIYVTSILKNENMIADPEKLKHWLPVDLYIGGRNAFFKVLYAKNL